MYPELRGRFVIKLMAGKAGEAAGGASLKAQGIVLKETHELPHTRGAKRGDGIHPSRLSPQRDPTAIVKEHL